MITCTDVHTFILRMHVRMVHGNIDHCTWWMYSYTSVRVAIYMYIAAWSFWYVATCSYTITFLISDIENILYTLKGIKASSETLILYNNIIWQKCYSYLIYIMYVEHEWLINEAELGFTTHLLDWRSYPEGWSESKTASVQFGCMGPGRYQLSVHVTTSETYIH